MSVKDDFKENVISAHDELIDVADDVENLLLAVGEFGYEPVVVGDLTARVSNILDLIDDAHEKLFDLNLYIDLQDSTVPEAGGNTDPAGNVSHTIDEPAHVTQPIPAHDNLISKPVESDYDKTQDPFVVKDADGNVIEEASPDHVADDAKVGILVDKEDAANSIPAPTEDGEGGVVDPVVRQEPDQYPATDQAGDVAVTVKPEAEPVRPDAAASDVAGDPKVESSIDHTAPNDAGVQSPDPAVTVPDEGQVKNDLKVPQQQGDAPETEQK